MSLCAVRLDGCGVSLRCPAGWLPRHFASSRSLQNTITAVVEVVGKDEKKNRVTLKTACLNQEGIVVVDGEATMVPFDSQG
ncbi:hotdog family protein [Bacilliculturomica massiliensis]|uniref:hypothetical protein n=1 Tax=Bacilliculturomica massiliensis TaxID=1917867 RepID=UPI001030B81A|nr:hypothetical protein [Bacilliculturomica massiliensis]